MLYEFSNAARILRSQNSLLQKENKSLQLTITSLRHASKFKKEYDDKWRGAYEVLRGQVKQIIRR